MPTLHNLNRLKDRRRELRSQGTTTEKILWNVLRDNRTGFKFKRQHSIGGYILDFYCAEKHLIIEIDGGIHNSKDQKEYDFIRDKFFKDLNYKVLRLKNDEVENNLVIVIRKIKEALH